jgi:hypothetical protein
MGVEIPPPFLDLVVQVGDAVDDRHWRFLYFGSFSAMKGQCSKARIKKRACEIASTPRSDPLQSRKFEN